MRRRALVAAAVAVLATGLCTPERTALADDDDEPPKRYFYKNLPYGSQSGFNPFQVIFNRGFDVLQLRPSRTMGTIKMSDLQNVGENLIDPFPAIRFDGESGWGTFLTTEIFPLNWTKHGARWLPNYTLHLMGGGETYAAMREWFLDHEAPAPAATVFSIAALFTGAILNETLENKGVIGYNTDALADLYVFDIAGVILFSFEGVRKFFSQTMILSDWSLQPAVTYPHGDIHNVGNYYSLKVPIPFYNRLRLFAYGGFSTLGGLSYKLDRQYSISAAGGVRVGRFDNIGGANNVQNIVGFEKSGAIFLDRNESLLAVVQVSDIFDYTVSANLYPNAFWTTDPGLGGWTAIGRDGKWVAGLSFTKSLGFGFGFGTR